MEGTMDTQVSETQYYLCDDCGQWIPTYVYHRQHLPELCNNYGGQGIGAGHVCLCNRHAGHGAFYFGDPRSHGCECGAMW